MALTKSERVRYKAAKKLIRYLVCLLRMKAVEHVHGEGCVYCLKLMLLPFSDTQELRGF